LKTELAKGNTYFAKLPIRFSKRSQKQFFTIEGQLSFKETPTFPTYEDHRMAMSFAPLAMYQAVRIEDPSVVNKSYGNYWRDLTVLGFDVKEINE
jgi:3-phosphoshikimate 1-carboxyvinyltransferase